MRRLAYLEGGVRRAAKVDANHGDVVAHLRKLGWSVESTARLGGGFPDLIVGKWRKFCALIEVKDGSKSPSARKLTPDEQAFAERWTGPYIVALSGEDAHAQLTALLREAA
jgi:hypothetical protein